MRTATTKRESRILPIRIDSLEVPRAGEAQREFSQAHGDAIAAEFDMGKFGYPVVNQVDQTNWVVDGQHRIYGLRKQPAATRGTTVECEVYENLNKQEMADLFLGRNRSRIVNAFERFTVAVTAGHARERAIMRVVTAAKLEIKKDQRKRCIFAVGGLQRVFEREGQCGSVRSAEASTRASRRSSFAPAGEMRSRKRSSCFGLIEWTAKPRSIRLSTTGPRGVSTATPTSPASLVANASSQSAICISPAPPCSNSRSPSTFPAASSTQA